MKRMNLPAAKQHRIGVRGFESTVLLMILPVMVFSGATLWAQGQIGREVAVPKHLQDGEEYKLSVPSLIQFGSRLFSANWTTQEGGGRPLTKGTGKPLADPTSPLVGTRGFNRVSAPDANSCTGCHNLPYGIAGGGGDIVTNVFVLGQRFDFATFDANDSLPAKGGRDEAGRIASLQNIGNSRATTGMFGAGYIEMLARQITADLQAIRSRIEPGHSAALQSKGISFGILLRKQDGSWDVSKVDGLPYPSISSRGPGDPPSLVIRPWHQAGAVVSLREFSNNAFNQHHGIQSSERFGAGEDPDGDGFTDELTRADVTAVSIFQAALAPPGRVIPNDAEVEIAIMKGESLFSSIGCATCHVPSLTLDGLGHLYSEPGPYNPPGNWQLKSGMRPVTIDLNSEDLPQPRLPFAAESGGVTVHAYTDFKLHDITSGPDDPNAEPLDMHQVAGSVMFFAGNSKFLTRRLWDSANQPPYFHHGRFTTMRESILAHAGEARESRQSFRELGQNDQNCLIEFLKSLQVLPPGTRAVYVDEQYRPRVWPPITVEHKFN